MPIPPDSATLGTDLGDAVHQVRLHGQPAGHDQGTITGVLPLWFEHEGSTWIRDAVTSRISEDPAVTTYRRALAT